MIFTKRLLSILACATIGLSACKDNPVYDYDNEEKWKEDNLKIEASPLTITGKLHSRKYVSYGNDLRYKPIPWKQGAGWLVAYSGGLPINVIAQVSVDGSFTMTFPGIEKYPNLLQFENWDSLLTSIPTHFLLLACPAISSFDFYPLDNPETSDINESQNCGIITPSLISDIDSCAYQDFEFMMSEDAALSFVSADKKHKYNYTYKKGWNIGTWKKENGVTVYSIVDSLPANVVWF